MFDRLRSRKLTTACVGAATVLIALGAAAPAAALPPRLEPAESGLPATLPAGFVCSFPVLVEEAEPSDLETIDFGDGRTVTRGRLVVRLTNVDTGDSIVRDVSGATRVRGDLVTFWGRGLHVVLPGNDPDVVPADRGLYVVQGTVVLRGPAFTRFDGIVEDVCQVLSPTGG